MPVLPKDFDINTIKPLGENVLVKRGETETKTASGLLLLPETRIQRNVKCTVVAVGKGKWCSESKTYATPDMNPGDIVLVREWCGVHVDELQDENLLIVRQDVIEAIFDE